MIAKLRCWQTDQGAVLLGHCHKATNITKFSLYFPGQVKALSTVASEFV